VLCWRCVRFSDEIAGDAFIQLVDRGPGTQILTFNDEPFDSYFSGNTIQICPVGALTSRPYRFVSRPWNLKSAPSVCSYCSVGCPITNESRYEKLVRCQALPNENVNDFWICDKGRFGYHYVDSEDRLKTPLERGSDDQFHDVSWEHALEKVADKLKDGARVGVIAGGHLTTEDAWAIGKLAKDVIGTRDVDSRVADAGAPYADVMSSGLSQAAGSSATINDLATARTIVWVGPDPKETLPVLYLKLRAAVLDHNAKLIVVSPRRLSLDAFATHVVRSEAGDEAHAVNRLMSFPAGNDLGEPLVICWGPSSPGRDDRATVAALARLGVAREAKLLMCPPHAGSQGLLDMGVHPELDAGHETAGEPGRDTRAILQAAADGELDVLLLFGADVIADFPDANLAERALQGGVHVVTVELFPTATATRSDILLPSAAYAEREGTFTNLERRIQKLEPLLVPPGATREPWRICASLARQLGSDWGWHTFDDVWNDIKSNVRTHEHIDTDVLAAREPTSAPHYQSGYEVDPTHSAGVMAGPGAQYPKGYRSGAPFQTGQNWPLSWELRGFEARQRPGILASTPTGAPPALDDAHLPHAAPTPGEESADGFVLYTGRLIYDEGAMVSKSTALRHIASSAFVELNEEDAKDLGLSEGDKAVVRANGTAARLEVRIADIARGAVFVPYDQRDFRANTLTAAPRVTVSRGEG
jgi:NADH-quinone oxidoreductase subunit G